VKDQQKAKIAISDFYRLAIKERSAEKNRKDENDTFGISIRLLLLLPYPPSLSTSPRSSLRSEMRVETNLSRCYYRAGIATIHHSPPPIRGSRSQRSTDQSGEPSFSVAQQQPSKYKSLLSVLRAHYQYYPNPTYPEAATVTAWMLESCPPGEMACCRRPSNSISIFGPEKTGGRILREGEKR
jgi:hypothetical protein